jgi:hypothetical protein
MPPIGMLPGNMDVNELYLRLNGQSPGRVVNFLADATLSRLAARCLRSPIFDYKVEHIK